MIALAHQVDIRLPGEDQHHEHQGLQLTQWKMQYMLGNQEEAQRRKN